MNQPHPQGRVYVRGSFADHLVAGTKTIETAHMRLPDRFLGRWLEVQNEHGQAVGMVIFTKHWQYPSREAFDQDADRHLVGPHSPYHFSNRRVTHGWYVSQAVKYPRPCDRPRMRSQFRLEIYGGAA